jgi:hypothetical protein
VLGNFICLPLLEVLILFAFLRSLIYDLQAKMRKGGTGGSIKRGDKSWGILLSFWSASLIPVGLIALSDLITKYASDYRIMISLINFGMLSYLSLRSVYFQNKIIGWYQKLRNREQQI